MRIRNKFFLLNYDLILNFIKAEEYKLAVSPYIESYLTGNEEFIWVSMILLNQNLILFDSSSRSQPEASCMNQDYSNVEGDFILISIHE